MQKIWNYLQELMILMAIPMVIGGISLSPRIIYAFYGNEFAPSVLALQLFIVVAGIGFMNYPYSVVLVATGNQKINFFLIASGAALNVFLAVLLLGVFGFYGAIVSIIVASLAVLSGTVFFTRRLSLVNPFNMTLAKVFFSAALSGLVMLFAIKQYHVSRMNIIMVVAIGMLVYGLALYVLYRFVLPERMALLRRWKSFY